jgi:hypothetical protein
MGLRVARWYFFLQKIKMWLYSGGPWNGKCSGSNLMNLEFTTTKSFFLK